MKSKIQDALFAALEAQLNHHEEISAAEIVDEETPITDKQKKIPLQADTTKVVAPTRDEKASSIAEPKQLDSENSTTKATTDEGKVGFLVSGVEGLGSDTPATNAKIASQVLEIPTLKVNPTVESPIVSTKPTIEVPQLAAKDDSAVEKALPAICPSKFEASEITARLDIESEPKKKNNNSGSKKNKKRKPAAKSDASHSSNSIASKDSSETLKSFFMTESTEHFVTAQSSPSPSLTSGPSESCVCTDDPSKSIAAGDTTISSSPENKQQPIIKHSKSDSNATVVSTPQSTIKSQRRQAHSKNNSSSSTSSTGSVRKTDQKSPQLGKKVDKNSNPEGKELSYLQEGSQPSSPAVNFEDSMQWPALAPSKTPFIDGKPPAVPTIQPLIERKKNPNAPIVPAVPLNMQRRRPS